MSPSSDATPVHLAVAVAGACLFMVALAAGAWLFLVELGRDPGGPLTVRPVAVNLSLFSIFALHHSLLARPALKALVLRAIPPHLERSSYVWTASALFLMTCAAWQPVGGTAWSLAGAAWWVGAGVQALGLLLTVAGARYVDVFELSGLAQVAAARRGTTWTTTPGESPFTRSGPYAWVRHPIYSGWLLMTFAAPVMTHGRLLFAVVSGAYLIVAVNWEERALRDRLPEAYAAYERQVKWRMMPGVY